MELLEVKITVLVQTVAGTNSRFHTAEETLWTQLGRWSEDNSWRSCRQRRVFGGFQQGSDLDTYGCHGSNSWGPAGGMEAAGTIQERGCYEAGAGVEAAGGHRCTGWCGGTTGRICSIVFGGWEAGRCLQWPVGFHLGTIHSERGRPWWNRLYRKPMRSQLDKLRWRHLWGIQEEMSSKLHTLRLELQKSSLKVKMSVHRCNAGPKHPVGLGLAPKFPQHDFQSTIRNFCVHQLN